MTAIDENCSSFPQIKSDIKYKPAAKAKEALMFPVDSAPAQEPEASSLQHMMLKELWCQTKMLSLTQKHGLTTERKLQRDA